MKRPSCRGFTIQLNISKNFRMLDLPQPFAPISTAAIGISSSEKSANDLKP